MCLTLEPYQTPENALKTAEKNITCYKVLKNNIYTTKEDNDKVLESLYQNFKYVIGRTYQQQPELGLRFKTKPGYYNIYGYYVYEVHEAFHSYKYEETALCDLYECAVLYNGCFVAVKCTIPKGSKYVENDYYYASDSIILNEIISEFRHKIKFK